MLLAALQQQPQQPGLLGFLLPMVLVFAIFYVLVLYPARKRQKKLQEMVGALKRGDMVVTNGGILGRVVRADDETVTLTVAPNVDIKFTKGAIAGMARDEEAAS
jgi:preprotein translocase subunit YajC